jgi:hypothetical protein
MERKRGGAGRREKDRKRKRGKERRRRVDRETERAARLFTIT